MREAGVTTPEYRPTPDKARLWDEFGSDLERWVNVGGFDAPHMDATSLAEMWEIFQRRQEQAL
jgi:hypothetical protein